MTRTAFDGPVSRHASDGANAVGTSATHVEFRVISVQEGETALEVIESFQATTELLLEDGIVEKIEEALSDETVPTPWRNIRDRDE